MKHGGELGVGKRKVARPIVTKRAMHVVLRASVAKGKLSLLRPKNARFIETEMARAGRRNGVKIYEFANVGNHLHLLLRAKTRDGFRVFLRTFAGKVAQGVTGAKKGNPFGKRFWDLTAFSRIVEWGNAFLTTRTYVIQNRLEASGVISYKPRAKKTARSP